MTISYKTYLLNIIKAVLNGVKFSAPEGAEVDFELLYRFAEVHQVGNVVGFCPESFEKASPELVKKFQYEKNRAVAREAAQEVVIRAFLEKMEEKKIRTLPLKGFCIKNMYPHPAVRSMTDTDILVEWEKPDEVCGAMGELGLNYDHDTLHETIFSNGQLLVELHKTLIPSNMGRLYDYYTDPWRLARSQNGKEYICEMSPEDFYIFTLGHIAKHYAGGGIGIKHIMDIYILEQGDYDRQYVAAELEKLRLDKFTNLVRKLAAVWFSNSDFPEYDEEVWELGKTILQSGAFGDAENRTASGIYRKQQTGASTSKAKMIFARIFPGLAHMRLLFPPLRRFPVLYPIFWFVRAYDMAFRRRNELKVLKNIASTEQSDVNAFANRLKNMGIPEDL